MVVLVGHTVPTENLQHTEKDASAFVDGHEVGTGTLYITESNVLWLNPSEEGIQLEYRAISLHAISRDLTSFPHEHLLLHYEGKLPGVNESSSSQSDDNEEEEDMECRQNDEGTLIEIKFVPQNKESLNSMFEAMSNCQVLHPDPDDDCKLSDDDFDDAEEENEGDFYTGEEGLNHLSEAGQANLDRLNNMLQVGQGDAEITTRTSRITITNGHHNPGDQDPSESEQFQDADGMNE